MEKLKEINRDYISGLLDELAKTRGIFHNEQDFQFELAQKIREKINDKNVSVRLEYYIGENEGHRTYIDIMIIEKGNNGKNDAIAIELKYKTKESEGYFLGEHYNLKDQGAADWGCYYIHRDLKRIEDLVVFNKNNKKYRNLENITVKRGFVIFLTSDYDTYKKERKGIFKNYSLNPNKDENNIEKVKKEGKILYCDKKIENKYYTYKQLKDKYYCPATGKFKDYSSVKGKDTIKFEKEHLGIWSPYSDLKEIDPSTKMSDKLEKLIFEVPVTDKKE